MIAGRIKWIEKTAKVFSFLFHPIFIPLYGLLVLYSFPTLLSYMPANLKKVILIMVFSNNIILPMSIAVLLYSRGTLKSIFARERIERNMLLAICFILYALTAFLLVKIPVANLFKAYFLSIAVVTLVTLIINNFYRISLHSTGAGGLLALAVCLIMVFNVVSVTYIVLLVIFSGAVLSSRLYLEEHKPAEVWGGLLTGTLVTGLVLFFLLR